MNRSFLHRANSDRRAAPGTKVSASQEVVQHASLAVRPPLIPLTDFASAPPLAPAFDEETGELQDGSSARLGRWRLQAAARRLLGSSHRVSTCLRRPRTGLGGSPAPGVTVCRRPDSGAAYYTGLIVCGNAWSCPCCASKISERRRIELLEAIRLHRATGGAVALLTLTVPHARESRAFELVDLTCQAIRRFWSGRARARLFADCGLVGSVRALEVTHGDANGWHPHTHHLLFLSADVDLAVLGERLFVHWARQVAAVGLGTALPDAFKLHDGSHASRYASKWGLAEELSKANVKQARALGRTPFALLHDYASGDARAGALFAEFAVAFKGRSQLRYSRGLRKHLGLGREATDEELAQAVPERTDEKVITISPRDWVLVCRLELRGVVLELARTFTAVELEHFISSHRPTAPP